MSLKFKIVIVVLIIYLILSLILCIGIFNWRNKFSNPLEKQMLKSSILNSTIGKVKNAKVKFFSFPKGGINKLEFNVKSEKGKFDVTVEMKMIDSKIIAKKYIIKDEKGEIYETYED